jgi:hypothetical protein
VVNCPNGASVFASSRAIELGVCAGGAVTTCHPTLAWACLNCPRELPPVENHAHASVEHAARTDGDAIRPTITY